MNSTSNDKHPVTHPGSTNTPPSGIEMLIKRMRKKAIAAVSEMNKDERTLIATWAQEVVDKYASVLTRKSTTLKSITELPCSKEDIKLAIKIIMAAHMTKGAVKAVNDLKDKFISLGGFQQIRREDKKKIQKYVNTVGKNLNDPATKTFPDLNPYINLLISEQNAMLDEINAFIEDLKPLTKDS